MKDLLNQSDVLFREVQRFSQPWIWAIIVGMNCLWLFFLGLALFAGSHPGMLSGYDLVPLVIPMLIIIPITALFVYGRMITEVRRDGLYVRFIPFHGAFKRYGLADIKSFQARTYRPIIEYSGWGIRYGSNGMAYNVSGNQGLQLELHDGQHVLIGSRKAGEMEQALRSVRGTRS